MLTEKGWPDVLIATGQSITSIINDRADWMKVVSSTGTLELVGVAGLLVFTLWQGVKEFQDQAEWTAFIPFTVVLIVVGGFLAWVNYFADHGAFIAWPIVVAVVVLGLVACRASAVERLRRERAQVAAMLARMVDKTPVHGNAQEATPDDERRGGL